jgi:transposase
MFIRKKKNAGGTTSIMLLTSDRRPGKKHSNLRLIKNFGASYDEEELNKLIQQAEDYKNHLLAVAPKAKALKIISGADVKSCRSYNVGFADIYARFFQTIFCGIDVKQKKFLPQLQDLVVMRIASPASKRKTAQLAAEYGIQLNTDSIYKLMDQITDTTIQQIKKIIYQHTVLLLSEKKESVDVLFYDLTTVYFETNSQDELRDFGFSKDGKHQHVQIMLAVIVTHDGLLVDYEEFPGNCFEGHTLIPVIEKIKSRYDINKIVLVADSALMNKINLQELTLKNIKYVIAARIKNLKKDLKQQILDSNEYQNIYTSIDQNGVLSDEIKTKIIALKTGDFIIAYHSSKRARKDEYERQSDLEKIKKYIHSTAKSKLTGRLRKPYVKVSKNCKIEIDLDKLALDQRYDGYFGLQTNLENIDPKEILSTYRGLWQVEQTFRIAKNNLEIRPVFHYTPRRIKAHFAICYMALALVRYVTFTLKNNGVTIPYEQLHLMLNRMRKVNLINSNDEQFEFLEDPPTELISVYQALKIKWPQKFKQKIAM